MAFDGIFAKALVSELSRVLTDARITKIQQPEKEELLLTFKTREYGQKRLLMSGSASLPLLYFTEETKASPLSAPNFCMLLRKHVGSGRIVSVTQPGLERIIDFTIEHTDELGDLKEKHLICEIMGKYSNIIFTDGSFMILDAIRHVPPTVSSVRTVLPGRNWFIPETQNKLDFLTETPEHFRENLKDNDTVLTCFTDHYTGLYRQTLAEFLSDRPLDADKYISACTEADLEALTEAFLDLQKILLTDAFSPEAAYRKNMPEAFSALPLLTYREDPEHYTVISFDSPSALLYTYYRDRNLSVNMKQRSYDTRKTAQTLLERAVKKLDLQNRQLEDAEKRERFRRYGELLNAYSYTLRGGGTSITLPDYMDDDREIEIPLDPDLSLADNAKAYFEKYGKMKRTFEALSVQVEETRQEIDHLSSILQSIDMAEDQEVLKQIREEMADAGFLKKTASQKGRRERIHSKPYHYRSSDGFDIYVGKNNLQNEWLTFKFADKDDIWMHAKNMPGSHVIIRKMGQEIPDRTYEEAASLAAYYSAGRNAEKVEVDYVEKKQLRKPNNGAPGFVVYYTNYSLMAGTDISGLTLEES
ncbi:MAG: NFACT family protein [Lachnospiraceae bacterium]|nr:NFACT family protein [Lachnospiraceae bacterium]